MRSELRKARTDFNPRSPCGERRINPDNSVNVKFNFNPRSPCGERLERVFYVISLPRFQSTLPVRGATLPATSNCRWVPHFNPRSPCGERQSETLLCST